MNSLRPAYRPRRPGFSLIEMVVSLSIVSVLLVGMTSAVVLASRALPSNDTPAAATVDSARALHQLRNDLSAATELLNRTATSVTLHLPDRDGDGRPEVITYAWSGRAGDALTRTTNGSTPTTLLDNVQSLALAYTTTDHPTVFPGIITTSDEEILSSWHHTEAADLENHELDSDAWAAAQITPNLPTNALNYTVTRLLVYGRKDGGNRSSTYALQVRPMNGSEPSATVIQSVPMYESDLEYSSTWVEAAFSAAGPFDAADDFALVLTHVSGGSTGEFKYDNKALANKNMLSSTDEGANWTYSYDNRLVHFAYGTYETADDDWTYTRDRITGVEVTLTHASAVATTHQLNIALLNTPEAADTVWQADFNADPTAFDADQDGEADWQDAGDFDNANLVDGAWSATDTLRSSPDNAALADPARLDVYLRDTTDNAIGGGVRLRFDRQGSRHACVAVEVNATETGQVVAVKNQTSAVLQTTWVKQTVEANTTARVTLTTDPTNSTVGVAINGEVVGSFAYETTKENESGALQPYTDASNSGVFLDHLRLSTGGTVALTPGAY